METKVLVGVQSAKGEPKTTGLNTVSHTDFGIKPEINSIESKVLSNGRWKTDAMAGRQSVAGDFGLEPNISEIELILEGAGFKKTSDTYSSSTFDKYLTIINKFEDKNLHTQFNDCLVNTININAAQESYVSVKVGVIGTGHLINKTAYTTKATVFEGERLVCYGAKIFQEESKLLANVEHFEININNSLEGKGSLNSRTFDKILQNGKGDITLTVQFNAFDETAYAEAMEMLTNNKSTSFKVLFQEDISSDTAKTGKVLEITMPKVKVKDLEIGDFEGAGSITKTMTVLPDEKGNPIYFKVTNAATESMGG